LYETPSAVSTPFKLVSTRWGTIHEGDETHPALADIDRDGKLDILAGNLRGGLAWYQSDLPSEFSTAHRHQREEYSMSIYPNPARLTAVLTTGDHHLRGKLDILDLSGRLIQAYPFAGNRLELDLSAYPPGVYLARISSASGQYSKKLVIAR
jgi:hypothetical protein